MLRLVPLSFVGWHVNKNRKLNKKEERWEAPAQQLDRWNKKARQVILVVKLLRTGEQTPTLSMAATNSILSFIVFHVVSLFILFSLSLFFSRRLTLFGVVTCSSIGTRSSELLHTPTWWEIDPDTAPGPISIHRPSLHFNRIITKRLSSRSCTHSFNSIAHSKWSNQNTAPYSIGQSTRMSKTTRSLLSDRSGNRSTPHGFRSIVKYFLTFS